MISSSAFLLGSYLMMAMSYTIASWIDAKQCVRHWYMLPFALLWCLLICWFYFPCEVGFKLYKLFNDTKKIKIGSLFIEKNEKESEYSKSLRKLKKYI